MNLSNLIIVLSPTLLVSTTLLRCLCEHATTLFPGVELNPNTPIPEYDESEDNTVSEKAAPQQSAKANSVRLELTQMYLYMVARNDTLVFMKEQLKTKLKEERKKLLEVQKTLDGTRGNGERVETYCRLLYMY